MSYIGDYTEDYATLNMKFTTRTTAGVPSTLGGTPVVAVYKGSATGTEKTSAEAYITLSVDFDSITGLNNVLIDLSGDAFFAVANDYYIVITTGTVNGVSVVGEVIGEFSIENRFMRGTDSANTVVPDAAGVAPTAVENRQEMDSNSTQLTAIVADTNELQVDWTNGGRLDLLLDAIPTTAMRGTDSAATAAALATHDAKIDALNDISVSDILTTQMTEAYAADGTAPTLAQALFAILQQAGEFSIADTTITVKKLDGTTTAMTFSLNNADNPTSRTRTT